jgi:WD40 repeat protein
MSGSSEGKAAYLVDIAKNKCLLSLKHVDTVNAVAFSPKSVHMLTGSGDSARVWDDTGKLLLRLKHDGKVGAVTFSPNGGLMLTGSKGTSYPLLMKNG